MTRRRYLAVKIESTQPVDETEFKRAIWGAVSRVFGEYGASKTGLVVIDYDENKHYSTLRCANAALEMVRASLASITEINAKPAAVHTLGVSGTLKSLRTNFPSANQK